MKTDELDRVLKETLADHRLSRGERTALRAVFDAAHGDPQRLAFIRHRAFALARDAVRGYEDQRVLEWVEDVIKLLIPTSPAAPARVLFSPEDDCVETLVQTFREAAASADVCVFTITDNRVSRAIRDAHKRGVAVRIITDDDKSEDLGSDVSDLARQGIAVRYDRSPHHMHHKFAVFDRAQVITGSYNWTRSAAEHNRENLVISRDPQLVGPYQRAFEHLWTETVER